MMTYNFIGTLTGNANINVVAVTASVTATATRAEVATIFARFLEILADAHE